mmetsp:Transcript_83340/g.269701  ORF Transcript_83340/g.269701 Transcript_83340/m.269701 type:complete len:289 (-) Transcript_83340:750-1616(-)
MLQHSQADGLIHLAVTLGDVVAGLRLGMLPVEAGQQLPVLLCAVEGFQSRSIDGQDGGGHDDVSAKAEAILAMDSVPAELRPPPLIRRGGPRGGVLLRRRRGRAFVRLQGPRFDRRDHRPVPQSFLPTLHLPLLACQHQQQLSRLCRGTATRGERRERSAIHQFQRRGVLKLWVVHAIARRIDWQVDEVCFCRIVHAASRTTEVLVDPNLGEAEAPRGTPQWFLPQGAVAHIFVDVDTHVGLARERQGAILLEEPLVVLKSSMVHLLGPMAIEGLQPPVPRPACHGLG